MDVNGTLLNYQSFYLKVKYKEIFYENAHPKIRDKPFMGSPIEIICAYLCYYLMITYILPRLMRDRKPFDFKKLYGYVDKLLLLVESYFFFSGIELWFKRFNWIYQPMGVFEESFENHVVDLSWQFLMAKFFYMFQNVPHVLSKRESPAAKYLLLHHSLFPLIMWTAINYYPGGHVTFIGFMNAMIHFTTSLFRIISNTFPKLGFEKYEPKVHLNANIVKFSICFLHSAQLLFRKNSDIPRWISYMEVYGLIFFGFAYYFIVARKEAKKKSK